MKQQLFVLASAALKANALSVVQWQDSMHIVANSFIDLNNANEAHFFSNDEASLQ